MNITNYEYCLDANVLIQAWQKYYSPKYCSEYWSVLDALGLQNKIYIPEIVYDEIIKTEDDLSSWLKKSNIPKLSITESVTKCLKDMYNTNPIHKFLADNTRYRSLADPWVIAHAMDTKSTVVTKEEKITASNTNKIKIPNVCDNMGIPWMNDFQLIEKLQIKFSCKLP